MHVLLHCNLLKFCHVYLPSAGSTSGEPVRNHSSVDKAAKKKTPELLIDKNKDDDWSTNENGHETHAQAPAGDISQHFTDTEMSRPKKLPEMSSGEPLRDSYGLGLDVQQDESPRGWLLLSL